MARTLVRHTLGFSAGLVFFAVTTPLGAQVIPVRTVPVASGDQFLTLPSATLGMGGLTLAVTDSLADPWTNPAQGVLIGEPAILASPTYYGISADGGSGRSFPLAAFLRGDGWFGGAAFALQQIRNEAGRDTWFWVGPVAPVDPQRLSDLSARNLYARGFVGRRLARGPWSFGVGFSAASLDAMDGVDLLYTNAERIEQSGSLADVRAGLYRDGDRDRLSLLVVHDRVSMTHDVTYLDVTWDESDGTPIWSRHVVVNEDRTRTWGVQATYDRDLTAPGWRLGTSLTVNRKSHPEIPDYEIQNIPRDPGTTWAYETGVGVSRTRGATTFGLDVVFQPIWSKTWQEADEDLVTTGGEVIREGERTLDNEFTFTNVVLRAGLSYRIGDASLQAGLEARSYDYDMEQWDHVADTFRDQREAWMEWSPSLGATFHVGDLELRYAGRLTTGTGQPGVTFTPDVLAARANLADFIIAPSGPLTLQDVSVITHQLAVVIPIR